MHLPEKLGKYKTLLRLSSPACSIWLLNQSSIAYLEMSAGGFQYPRMHKTSPIAMSWHKAKNQGETSNK